MLSAVHQSFGQLLHRRGFIPEDVDVRCEAPTRQWVDSLTRPTISFFLFDIQENKEKRDTSLQTVRANGRAERRMPPRRIDLFYSVSAFATEIADEHEILWRTLATLMKYPQIPADVLPNSMKDLDPPFTARMGEQSDTERLPELWNSREYRSIRHSATSLPRPWISISPSRPRSCSRASRDIRNRSSAPSIERRFRSVE